MYGQGNGTIPACVAGVTCLGAAVLPKTGMSTAIQLALAAAVGLAVWAVVYVVMSKFAKR